MVTVHFSSQSFGIAKQIWYPNGRKAQSLRYPGTLTEHLQNKRTHSDTNANAKPH